MIYNDEEALLDNIFDEKWYTDTVSAINLALNYLNNHNTNLNPEEIIQQVLDYNVDKQLDEVILNKILAELPKELNWENKAITEAFMEFKKIIDSCNMCPSFKKFTIRVKTSNSTIMKNEFLSWKELVNEYYPKLLLNTIPYKSNKNKYKLNITLAKD